MVEAEPLLGSEVEEEPAFDQGFEPALLPAAPSEEGFSDDSDAFPALPSPSEPEFPVAPIYAPASVPAASKQATGPSRPAHAVPAQHERRRRAFKRAAATLAALSLIAAIAAGLMFSQADRIRQEASTTASYERASYAYQVELPDGSRCDVMETASYGAGNILVESAVEATLPSEGQARDFVAEAEAKFGDAVKETGVDGKTARVVIDLGQSGVGRGAYEALLSNNAESFELVG